MSICYWHFYVKILSLYATILCLMYAPIPMLYFYVNMLCFLCQFFMFLYLRYISMSLWYVYMIVNICVVSGHQSDVWWQKIFPICGISYFYFTHRHTTSPHRDIILLDMFPDKVTLPLKLLVQLKICLCLILISHLDRPNFWLSDFTNSSHKTC